MKNGGNGVYVIYPDGDITSLSVPGGLSAPAIELRYWPFAQLQSTCKTVGKMGNIAIFIDSLTTLQALNSVDPDQMIQGLHSSLAKLTAQFSVSLQLVPAHVGLAGNETADRLAKIGRKTPQTQNPVTYSRHFFTPGSTET